MFGFALHLVLPVVRHINGTLLVLTLIADKTAVSRGDTTPVGHTAARTLQSQQ